MTDPAPPADSPSLGEAARLLVEAAELEARGLGHGFTGTEHVLLALLADPALAEVAASRGVPGRDELRARLKSAAGPRQPADRPGGLSSHARRLLEQADRAARESGALAIDRRWILDRLLAGPKGPLARVMGPAGGPGEAGKAEGGKGKGKAEGEGPQPPKQARERPADRGPARPARRGDAPTSPDGAGRDKAPPPRAEPSPPARPPRERRPAPPIRSRPAVPLSWRAVMLAFVPATVALAWFFEAPPVAVFVVACLGVVPLAGYMGEATEHLAARTGPAVGGLLNATFGNAAELIIAIVALQAGLVELVKASITGSILGNLLLIMGLSFVAGGVGRTTVRFSRVATGASAGMLALAVAGLVFPALLHHLTPGQSFRQELPLSEAVAVVLVATYGFSLLFTLRTHRTLFGEPHPLSDRVWPAGRALLVLGLATAGIVVQSEVLVGAVEAVTASLGVSEVFLGLIVVPLVGNAAEHASAILVARKGQMDLSLSIALGSSTQVALLVAPVLVGVGLLLGQPMDLVFTPFEVVALGLTTVVTAILTLDGEGHWFDGVQLLAMYLLVAAAAFFV